jgi:hypothetical protein
MVVSASLEISEPSFPALFISVSVKQPSIVAKIISTPAHTSVLPYGTPAWPGHVFIIESFFLYLMSCTFWNNSKHPCYEISIRTISDLFKAVPKDCFLFVLFVRVSSGYIFIPSIDSYSCLTFPVSHLPFPMALLCSEKDICLYLYRIKPLSLLIPVLIGITLKRLVAHIHVGYFICGVNACLYY